MIRHMNKAQRAWCANYENMTGFEPLIDDYYVGNESFVQAAKKSVRWFEDWSSEAFLDVSRYIPGEWS